MSATADAAILLQAERLAMIRRTWAGGITGTGFWDKVDAAADATYENQIKGSDITAMDAALAAANIGNWPSIVKWFSLHQAYFAAPTTADTPGLGYTTDPWNSFLKAHGMRVPHDFNELFYANYRLRLDPQCVYPKGLWNANIGANATALLHKFGSKTRNGSNNDWTDAFVVADGALATSYAPVIAVSTGGVTGSANITTVTTCTNQTGATKSVTKASQSFAANAQAVVGEAVVTATATAGATSITSAGILAAGAFTDGEWVVITDGAAGNSKTELVQINVVSTDAISLKTALLNTWALTSSFIWPLYSNVTACTVTAASSTTTQSIQFYARPDRAIAL